VSPSGGVRCTCNLGNGRCNSTDAVAIAGAPPSVRAFGNTEVGCALTRDKKVWCWNTYLSQSGRVLPELTGIEELVEYDVAWCARSDDGKVFCFGSNHAGQLGRGYITVTGDPDEPPTPPDKPMPLDLRASALAPGLVITTNGELRVWGANARGQRKPDAASDLGRPVDPGTVANARVVAASSDRACAVDDRGQVWCWGLPAPVSPDKPHDLPEVKDAIAVSSAKHQVCALRKSGEVACWGRRLDAPQDPVSEPKSLGVTDAVEIAISP
jgi:alpha-tubulin suppressor-like RCC1 family protein